MSTRGWVLRRTSAFACSSFEADTTAGVDTERCRGGVGGDAAAGRAGRMAAAFGSSDALLALSLVAAPSMSAWGVHGATRNQNNIHKQADADDDRWTGRTAAGSVAAVAAGRHFKNATCTTGN